MSVGSKRAIEGLRATPANIKRANRLIVNRIVALVHKDTGGQLPRGSGVKITGFRRVRTRKTSAKAKQRVAVGRVWLGGNKIRSHWLSGTPVKTNGGVRQGKHFFADSFIATMGNGYRGVWRRSQDNKLIERNVNVDNIESISEASVSKNSKGSEDMIRAEIIKAINARKR